MIEGLHGVDQAPASELPALLAVRFAAAPADAWIARLTAAGLSAQVARDVQDNMADPVHVALASASCATIPNLAGSAMSGVRVGSRAPRSTPCSRGRRSGATPARSSKRPVGAPALASSSPTGLSQSNCLPGRRRASGGRRRQCRRAKSSARCGLWSKHRGPAACDGGSSHRGLSVPRLTAPALPRR